MVPGAVVCRNVGDASPSDKLLYPDLITSVSDLSLQLTHTQTHRNRADTPSERHNMQRFESMVIKWYLCAVKYLSFKLLFEDYRCLCRILLYEGGGENPTAFTLGVWSTHTCFSYAHKATLCDSNLTLLSWHTTHTHTQASLVRISSKPALCALPWP